jgi:membrane protease YdiL (CAAX protease family)
VTEGSAPTRPSSRPLVAFFVLTYALSWGWAIPLAASGQVVEQGRGWPTHYPALLGPAVAAVAVVAWTRGVPGLRDLGARLVRWRVPARWWLAALSPLALAAVVLLVLWVTGQELPAVSDFGLFSGTATLGVAGVVAVIVLVNAVGEEVGWRGYALPELQGRLDPLAATLVLALLWFGWHLPYFWLLDSYRDLGPLQPFGMLFELACGAVVLTWLYNRSGGSLLLVVVWHGAFNVVTGTQAGAGPLQVAVTALVMVLGIRLTVQHVRARRSGAPSVLDPSEPAGRVPAASSTGGGA